VTDDVALDRPIQGEAVGPLPVGTLVIHRVVLRLAPFLDDVARRGREKNAVLDFDVALLQADRKGRVLFLRGAMGLVEDRQIKPPPAYFLRFLDTSGRVVGGKKDKLGAALHPLRDLVRVGAGGIIAEPATHASEVPAVIELVHLPFRGKLVEQFQGGRLHQDEHARARAKSLRQPEPDQRLAAAAGQLGLGPACFTQARAQAFQAVDLMGKEFLGHAR
jgi:hypothetical protein